MTSEEVRAIPFPPCGENSIMLSPSSFFLANPLCSEHEEEIKKLAPFRFRLAAKTALCAFLLPFSSQTRFAGLCSEDGGDKEVRAIPFPPCGENCTMRVPSSFFLANPLRWALLGGRGSKETCTVPFPPCGENSIMLSPSSFFLANPLRWALLGGRGR